MSRWIGRLSAVVVALCALSLGAAFATPASGAISLVPSIGGPGKPAPQPTNPTPGALLTNVAGGTLDTAANRIGLGTLGSMIVCPASVTLRDLLAPVPGTAALLDPLVLAACAMHFLDFEWRTTHPAPSNAITGDRIVTTLGVPTPLNMDSDPAPDLLATVTVMGLNKIGIMFRRINEFGDMPGTAELVLTDPSRGSLPASHMSIGIDSRNGRMPYGFALTFTLESFKAPLDYSAPPVFRFDVEASRQPQPVRFFADLFDENQSGTVRSSLARASVGQVPVPKTLSTRIAAKVDPSADPNGPDAKRIDAYDIDATATEPTKLDADAVINGQPDGAGNKPTDRITATIDKVPTQMNLRYSPATSSRSRSSITYDASAAIAKVGATYDRFATAPGGSPQLKLHGQLDVEHVPRHMDLAFDSATSEIKFHGKDGAGNPDGVGSVTARVQTANPPPLPPLAASHAAYRQVGDEYVAQARVTGIRTIEVKPSPLHAVVDSDVLQALDLDAARDTDGTPGFEQSVNAKLRSNITKVTVDNATDPDGNHIRVDTGTPLGSLEMTAHDGTNALPLGIHDIGLTLEGLPEITKVDFTRNADVVDVNLLRHDVNGNVVKADGIDLIEAHINGGSAPTSYTDHQATPRTFTDTDGLRAYLDAAGNITQAGFRLRGLRGFGFGTRPNTFVKADVNQSQARPFVIDARIGSTFATGVIDKLPSDLRVDIAPAADTPIHYRAHERISEIELFSNAAAPAIPGVIARVTNVPKEFEVCARTDGRRASCMPSNRFDSATDKLVSFAYESDVPIGEPAAGVHVDVCFSSQTCAPGGMTLAIGVTVPRKLEFEAGASANLGQGPRFDCWDNIEVPRGNAAEYAAIVAANAARAIGDTACTVAFPVRYAADVVLGARAHGFVWFNTGATDLNGSAVLTIPPPAGIFLEPVVITLNTPTFNANGAFLDATLSFQSIKDGAVFTGGGSMSCNGGDLNVRTAVGGWLGTLDISGVANFVNSIVPGSPVPQTLVLPTISVPIDMDLVRSFC
jgi:hypothetical protein